MCFVVPATDSAALARMSLVLRSAATDVHQLYSAVGRGRSSCDLTNSVLVVAYLSVLNPQFIVTSM